MRTSFLTMLCLLFSIACGGDDAGQGGGAGGGGAGGSPPAGGSNGGDDLEGCGVQGTADAIDDVAGKWAMLEVASRLAQAPGLAEPIPNQSITLYLLDQTQAESDVSVSGEFCDQWVNDPDSSVVHTQIPDSYLVALPPFTLTGTYVVGDDGVGRYELDPFTQIIGGDLSDPAAPLPENPDDPGVIDEDQDGNPGVTVVLTGIVTGDAYVISRRVSTISAVSTAADRMSGLLDFEAQENILASNPETIKALGPVVVPNPDACLSTVELVRVADDADCATLLGQYETLFPGGVARP
jgi:hypothetical protein